VFQQHYYDEVTQVKCSLSSERWRFESIIDQLVIYSLHKLHSSAKVRYWSPSQLFKKISSSLGTTCTGGRPTAFRSYHRTPVSYHTFPGTVRCGQSTRSNNLPVSRSKGTLFGQLNVRHAFNMTRGSTTVGL
jgi:hypothetical protein